MKKQPWKLETWHIEAAVIWFVLVSAYLFDLHHSPPDSWRKLADSFVRLLVAYAVTREASVRNRMDERSAARVERWDLLTCLQKLWRYRAVRMVGTAWLMLAGGAALPIASLAISVAYPRWRRWYRRCDGCGAPGAYLEGRTWICRDAQACVRRMNAETYAAVAG